MLRQQSYTFVILSLVGQIILSSGFLLRRRDSTEASSSVVAGNGMLDTIALSNSGKPVKIHDEISYEVVNKTSINKSGSHDCLCKIGSFWHWRIKSCVKQGAWGYECGFFPEEHHDKVCKDSLKCVALDQDRVKYFHPGAKPASCQACAPEDHCLTGETRHSESCLKEYMLSGEACQTVRIAVKATAAAKVMEKVTKSGTAEATATAKATEKAVSSDGKATATKKATAKGDATATAKASSTAHAEAEATEKGVADGTSCVSVDEVKEILKLKDVPRIGAVLAAKVVSTGDEEAFDRAYAKALEAAKEAGILNAMDAAEALAKAKAREHAGFDALAKANEAAAWQAEAGAKLDAQAKAKAEALNQAQEAAEKEADEAAKIAQKKAEASAKASAKAAKGAGKDAAQDAAAAAAKAREDAEAAAARADAIRDIIGPSPTEAPVQITTQKPTGAPRKMSPADIAAGLP